MGWLLGLPGITSLKHDHEIRNNLQVRINPTGWLCWLYLPNKGSLAEALKACNLNQKYEGTHSRRKVSESLRFLVNPGR